MALNLTCPACATAFTLPDNMRYKKAPCPRCKVSLLISATGVAKLNETALPAPAPAVPPRAVPPCAAPPCAAPSDAEPSLNRNYRWLIFAVPLVLVAVGLWIAVATRGHTDEPKPVAKNDDGQPPPAPAPKEQPAPPPPSIPKEPDKGTAVPPPPKEPAKTSGAFQLPFDALGKPERLARVKGVRLEMTYADSKDAPKDKTKACAWSWFAPDKWRIDFVENKPAVALVINGQSGWVGIPGQNVPGGPMPAIPENIVTQLKNYFGWIGVGQLRWLQDAKYKLTVLEPATVKGRPTTCVRVEVEGSAEVKLYFDRDTRLLAKAEYEGPDIGLDVQTTARPNKHLELYFSDYRETEQIQQWRKMEWSWDGKQGGYFEVTAVRFLGTADEKLLTEP